MSLDFLLPPGKLMVQYQLPNGDVYAREDSFFGDTHSSWLLPFLVETVNSLTQMMVSNGAAQWNDPDILPIDIGDESV